MGETHRSVSLGKSPLPTHRGAGLLPQCVQKEVWEKPEQLKFCSTLGFSEFLPQVGTSASQLSLYVWVRQSERYRGYKRELDYFDRGKIYVGK